MEGNASHVSLPAAPSRLAFREGYIGRFLPLLSNVHERSTMKRYKAVKKAADFSLACTAGRTLWSKALCKSLFVQTAWKQRRRSFGFTVNEARFAVLKRLRRRRSRSARAKSLGYRKSYLRALRTTHSGKLGVTQPKNKDRLVSCMQCGMLEAAKLSCLSELVPGGQHMDLPDLLDQTGHYILSLQLQVDALSFLSRALSA